MRGAIVARREPERREVLRGAAAVAATLACRAGRSTTPSTGPRRLRRRYTAAELGAGFKAVKRSPPSLEILTDDTAYQAAAERDGLEYRVPDHEVPGVNFDKDVVVLLERGDEGGADIRPTVKRVVRRADVLTIDTGFARLPDAQDLDLMARPYLYFSLPREALDGHPRLELIVDGDRITP